jgi:hypothetical protein
VGGGALPMSDSAAPGNFTGELRKILCLLPRLDVAASASSEFAITSSMTESRNSSLSERKQRYLNDRVKDQVGWYGKKANWNKKLAKRWFIALVAVEGAAVILGVLRATSSFDVNLLGTFAAAAAGIAAWQQTKNYSYLSESYAVTTHEVKLISSAIQDVSDEDEWAQAVQDSESAFSREHTLWISRAHPSG